MLAWAGALLLTAVGLALWEWHLTVNYASAIATVITAEPRYIGETGGLGGAVSAQYRPRLTLQYSVDGRIIRTQILGPGWLQAKPGETVRIRYRKSRPEACFVSEVSK